MQYTFDLDKLKNKEKFLELVNEDPNDLMRYLIDLNEYPTFELSRHNKEMPTLSFWSSDYNVGWDDFITIYGYSFSELFAKGIMIKKYHEYDFIDFKNGVEIIKELNN